MFIEKRGFGMRLVDIVKSECVVAGMEASGKEDCLEKIAHIAKKSSLLDGVTEADILAGFKNREELGSTGYGHGIAIPHCRLPGVEDFVVGVITVPAGVDFDS
ncbi:MAG: PTS sugar transporter subunit IIA, partial [Kiritimatiellae bacterium]|nr:PTS sugar transporter subunit IIA [Kiritimatiellia bacterium]